ncbi:hypothetical protein D0T56_16430 [Dysgonomonas sp. 520]|nr:hypothetical protein [Dysgonomonas sp. 520]
MALIQCPECEKEFSEHAKNCPNCGYPPSNKKVKDTVGRVNDTVKETSNALKPWLMLIGGILLTLGGIFVLLSGSLEKVGYMKTFAFFFFGIGLITSGTKILKN